MSLTFFFKKQSTEKVLQQLNLHCGSESVRQNEMYFGPTSIKLNNLGKS